MNKSDQKFKMYLVSKHTENKNNKETAQTVQQAASDRSIIDYNYIKWVLLKMKKHQPQLVWIIIKDLRIITSMYNALH